MLTKFQKSLADLQNSKHTIRSYISDLHTMIKLGIINKDMSQTNFSSLPSLPYSPSTLRHFRASMQKYARFLVNEGTLSQIPPILSTIELPKIKRVIPKITSTDVIKEIINMTEDNEIKLILQILGVTGCRISSLVGLNIEDIGEKITFNTAKGNQAFVTLGSPEISRLLKLVTKRETGPVFTINGKDRASESCIRARLRRKLGKNYRPAHSIRHGIATKLAESGIEISEISRFLNHKSVSTTAIYIHMGDTISTNIKQRHPLL